MFFFNFFLFFLFLFFFCFLFCFYFVLHETIDRQSPAESDEVVQCSSGKRFGGRQLTNIIIMMASEGLLDSSDLLNYTGVFLR